MKNELKSNKKENEMLLVKSDDKLDTNNYINCRCCKLRSSILFSYLFAISSFIVTCNIRILFGKFNFKFNFSFLFLQQIFSLIIFSLSYCFSKSFKEIVGELSFSDFCKLKWQYILFTLIFMSNQLFSFYGNYLVKNSAMMQILRKFILLFTFFYEFFIEQRQIDPLHIFSMLLLMTGAICIGKDDFSRDYIGYIVVFLYNIVSLIYIKYGEHFRKNYKVTNIKLLIYNSYIIHPFLLLGFLITEEYKNIYFFFFTEVHIQMFYIQLGLSVFICCILVGILNMSFIISNEKNSGFFTQLVNSTKDFFVVLVAYIVMRDFNPSLLTIFGLICNTIGSVTFNAKSLHQLFYKTDKHNDKKQEGIELEKKDFDNPKKENLNEN